MEAVIASDEESKRLHKELYHCPDDAYRFAGDDIFAAIRGLGGDFRRLHVATGWPDILRLAVWKVDPGIGDLFVLLRSVGLREEELLPFRASATGDIFPWLYYGRRLDVLRKICCIAKTNVESHLKDRDTRVYTHLISQDLRGIVASSL